MRIWRESLPSPYSMSLGSKDDFWTVAFPKWAAMDATLMSELDRLAADYDLSADECLTQLMVLRAEREGTDTARMMVDTAASLWEKFKPGSKDLNYWAASREARQAPAILKGPPGANSAYAIMRRNALERQR